MTRAASSTGFSRGGICHSEVASLLSFGGSGQKPSAGEKRYHELWLSRRHSIAGAESSFRGRSQGRQRFTSCGPGHDPMSEPQQETKLDTLRIYGISFDFPATQKLEFDPKFTREEGSVAVKSPTKSVVFVTWGDLRRIVKRLPSPAEHSKYSMERAAKSARGKLNKAELRDAEINGHSVAYSRAEVEMPKVILGPHRPDQQIESMHLHCDRTSRYFVIYTSSDWGGPSAQDREDVFRVVTRTFKCH